jgi:hypothetical protein
MYLLFRVYMRTTVVSHTVAVQGDLVAASSLRRPHSPRHVATCDLMTHNGAKHVHTACNAESIFLVIFRVCPG